MGSSWSNCCCGRRFLVFLRSRTWVVAMLTTAGSTRFTMPEKEDAEGIGARTASLVALVPPNENAFIADTRAETTEPIIIPTVSVNATKKEAKTLRQRA